MRESSEHYQSSIGKTIFRRTFSPDGPITSGAVLIHGLGDHTGRHHRHLEKFTSRGIVCCGIDLPGHGLSDGKRGHIDNMASVLTLLEETQSHVRSLVPTTAQIGLFGHSMGGFLGLFYLSRYPDLFDYAWISSPLIDPRQHLSWVARKAAWTLNWIWPSMTVKNRVRSGQCKRDPVAIAETLSDPLIHRSLSVSLGVMLMREAPKLLSGNFSADLNLLMTHGSDDPVCPSRLSREYFDHISSPNKQYSLFEGMLHEPFNDLGKEAVFEAVDVWLDSLFPSDEKNLELALARVR